MTAKAIIPAPTLFEKLLIISGLKKVTPARNIEPSEQAVLISQIQAEAVFIYHCQIIEKMQGKSATETIIGGKPLSRTEVEKLPKFVELLAGSLPL